MTTGSRVLLLRSKIALHEVFRKLRRIRVGEILSEISLDVMFIKVLISGITIVSVRLH